jgi:hypothetical protein
MVLFSGSPLDGGSDALDYSLAGFFNGSRLVFMPPRAVDQSLFAVDGSGNLCGTFYPGRVPTVFLVDGGQLQMASSQGDCKHISNRYWLAETTTGIRIASVLDAQSSQIRLSSDPYSTVNVIGVDDEGRVAFQTREARDGGPYLFRVEVLQLDGGVYLLTVPSGGEPTADAFETSGTIAGQIHFAGRLELGVWRLREGGSELLLHLPMPYSALTAGVSSSGDVCGLYYGLPVQSFLLPSGFGRVLNTDEIPGLAGLECRAVLSDGAFLLVSGESARTVVALIRRGE